MDDAVHIGLIGAGRLGTCLALALQRAGYAIGSIGSAECSDAQELCERLPAAEVASAQEVARRCELVFLTVPDAQVSELAASLSWRVGQRVVHCSGALSLAALDAAARAGALRGCLHPLQSFPERFGKPERFVGITCGVEADGELGAQLEDCCRALGAAVLRLEAVDRAAYHAAAVFASNYVIALHAAAEQAWGRAGLAPELARAALAPLTLGAAQQIARLPLERALTGPLARGDCATLEAHLRALRGEPALHDLYLRLAAVLLELPIGLSAAQRAQLQALLSLASGEAGGP